MRIDAAHKTALSAPHVVKCWFAHLRIPGAERRLCQADGPVTAGGYEWEGTTDPFGAQIVRIEEIPEPVVGEAPVVRIVISGANKEWRRGIFSSSPIKGTLCDLYFATFDAETQTEIVPLTKLFPGRLTAPQMVADGAEVRHVMVGVEHIGAAINYPAPDMEWSAAGQRSRYPGDSGLDLMKTGRREKYKS
ncbi:hypothetical protein ATO13_23171 [Stappia sp. 22II-S9-Z10]|nr:hypothetical protein ATO13_23171 [Stappia sp. 22II-S9-Z10]